MTLPVTFLMSDQLPLDQRLLLMECARALEASGRRVEGLILDSMPGRLREVTLPGARFPTSEKGIVNDVLGALDGPLVAVDAASAGILSKSRCTRRFRLHLDASRSEANEAPGSTEPRLPELALGPWVGELLASRQSTPAVVPLPFSVQPMSVMPLEERPYDICVIVEGEWARDSVQVLEAAALYLERVPDSKAAILGLPTTWVPGQAQYLGTAEDQTIQRALSESRCLIGGSNTQLAVMRVIQAILNGCQVVTQPHERLSCLEQYLSLVEPDVEFVVNALVGLRDLPRPDSAVERLQDMKWAGDFACEFEEALGLADRPSGRIVKPTVSVVIPTKNAGGEFRYLLTKLNDVREFDVEILVIDSGSNDETLALSRLHGATVIEIPPEEFSHSGTRNRAAAAASGDYLLFMSQDVIPIGDDWLQRLMAPLLADARTVVAHGRDVPRFDADVFMCWLAKNAYDGLAWIEDIICGGDGREFSLLPGHEKRRLAQLADTCCLIRRDVFDEFSFSDVSYGEDLDLGYRLLKRGYRLAHMHTVGIIHSHNRSALYFLKRTYVDATVVPEILEDRVSGPRVPLELALWSISDLYFRVRRALAYAELTGPTDKVFGGIMREILSGGPIPSTVQDLEFDQWIRTLPGQNVDPAAQNLFADYFMQNLGSFADYCSSLHSTSHGIEQEIVQSVYKVLGVVVGGGLGTLAASHPEFKAELGELHAQLGRGV